MESDNNPMRKTSIEVNNILYQGFRQRRFGNLTLAAYFVSEEALEVSILRDKQLDDFERTTQNSQSLDDVYEFDEIMDPLEKAELALAAKLDGARAVFRLSEKQAKKVKKMALREFWLGERTSIIGEETV